MKKESKPEYLQFVNDNQNKFETEEFINKLRHGALNKENVDIILTILGLKVCTNNQRLLYSVIEPIEDIHNDAASIWITSLKVIFNVISLSYMNLEFENDNIKKMYDAYVLGQTSVDNVDIIQTF
jgi:hypothetical protein